MQRAADKIRDTFAEREKILAPLRPIHCLQFGIDEWETHTYDVWFKEHREKCPHVNYELAKKMNMPRAAGGGALTFSFTATGIGQVATVQCACGEKKDLTDYETW